MTSVWPFTITPKSPWASQVMIPLSTEPLVPLVVREGVSAAVLLRRSDPHGRADDPVTLEELQTLYESMPLGSTINLPRDDIAELLDELTPPDDEALEVSDLTLFAVAERVGRAPSTVRGWCSRGLLVGAYRLNGRDWRVPPAALDAFLEAQGTRRAAASKGSSGGTDLSAWRCE